MLSYMERCSRTVPVRTSTPSRPPLTNPRTATTLAPNSLEAHWARAYVYQLTGNQELAVQEYLAAININKNISEIHLELGVTYKALGVIDQAIQQYTLANTLDPTDYLPELYSSRALASIGQFTQAEQYAECRRSGCAYRSIRAR